MRELIDRIVIYCLCVNLAVLLGCDYILGAMAVSFCVSGLCYYVDKEREKLFLVFAFGFCLVVILDWCIFLPVIIYELTGILYKNKKQKCGYVMIAFCLILAYMFANERIFKELISVLILCIVALWICLVDMKLYVCEKKLIVTRDNDEQLRIELENRNRALIRNQDNELYLATLKERNRIAREIHDNVGHMLSRAILQMGAIKTISKEKNIAPVLDGLHESLNQAMNNIRSSVHDLHDESVDLEFSIKEALKPLSKFNVSLIYDVNENMDRAIKYSVISIIKESVSNIIKHSNATNVEVMLREHPGFYQLVIFDNGNKKTSASSGIGLVNMNDRVETLGGSMNISRENGFRVFIRIPKEK